MWIQDDGIMVEIQLMAYIVPMAIAMEVGIFFLYQYFKTRHAKLKLNRILLSYSTLVLLMVWGTLFLVLRRVLDVGDEQGDALFATGFIMVCSTPLGFLGFIATRDLSTIINVKLAKVLVVLSVIPMIVLVAAGTGSPWFLPSMSFTAGSALFLVYFQVKMIKLALGRLKGKLIQLFTGELIALSSLVFAANATFGFIPFISAETSFFTAVTILTAGFLLLFWAANDFPPFYEFEWRDSLTKLFIVDARDFSFLFARDFQSRGDNDRMDERDELFSGAISGIEGMIDSITGTSGKGVINKIEREGSIIFLERGTISDPPLLYILLASRDLNSMTAFLRDIRNMFETRFKDTLVQLHRSEPDKRKDLTGLFSSFGASLDQLVT